MYKRQAPPIPPASKSAAPPPPPEVPVIIPEQGAPQHKAPVPPIPHLPEMPDEFSQGPPLPPHPPVDTPVVPETQRSMAPPPPLPTKFPPPPMEPIAQTSSLTSSTMMRRSTTTTIFPEGPKISFDPHDSWWLNKQLPSDFKYKYLFEVEDHKVKKRLGQTWIIRDYYILFEDYSQLQICLNFNEKDPQGTVTCQQFFKDKPTDLTKLEGYSKRIGLGIIQKAHSKIGLTGSSHLVTSILDELKSEKILAPISSRTYGMSVFDYKPDTPIDSEALKNVRAGDILVIRKGKFESHNKLGAKSITSIGMDSVPYSSIITEYDFTKSKFRVIEEHSGKVIQSSYKLSHMRSGKLKVFRVVGRDYVGW